MELYSLRDFLEQIQDLDWHEIITAANAKCASLERSSYGVKGAIKKRESGSIDLAEKIKGLLFWLQNGIKPVGLTESEFQMLRSICIKLIEKKQLRREALNIFN